MTDIVRDCPSCGSARQFSQIHGVGPCPDSRDGCCPEWFCTACGTAVLLGIAPGRPQTAPGRPAAARSGDADAAAGRLDRVA